MCQRRIIEDCFLLNCSEFRSNDSTGVFFRASITKITNHKLDLESLGRLFPKSTQRLRACGGQISPGSTRRLEGLAKSFGSIILQGHPFVGQGRNCWRNGLTQGWIDSGPDGSLDLSIIHGIDSILLRSTLRRWN
jgi:hypothetical protein